MPAPTNQQNDSGNHSARQGDGSLWLKIRNWLISIVIIMLVSAVVERVVEHFSEVSLRELAELNETFVREVEQVNPFKVSGLFYGYLITGEPPSTTHGLLNPRPSLEQRSFSWVQMLWRVIPGLFYTGKVIVSEGLVSAFTAFVALFIGFAWVWPGLKKSDSFVNMLMLLLCVPLIGSVFLWLLLTLMWLIGLLFGWLLVSAQTITYLSIVGTCVKVVVKEREHHLTGKLIGRLTGEH